jgi:hypothetical protein
MTATPRTAADHGADDATTAYNEWSDDVSPIESVAAMRAGREELPDEALINAMGANWIIQQATGDEAAEQTDENWEMIGLPWCAAYNAAYLARLQELASAAAQGE